MHKGPCVLRACVGLQGPRVKTQARQCMLRDLGEGTARELWSCCKDQPGAARGKAQCLLLALQSLGIPPHSPGHLLWVPGLL